jgi:predicted ArsR family transcriptional regulator
MASAPDLDQRETVYLKTMVEHCQGDTGKQISMYAVGEQLGLDRETASQVCQELIAFGLVEIRTLSGGVGLTAEGIQAGGMAGGASVEAGPRLKTGPILDDEDRLAVTAVVDQLKQTSGGWQLGYEEMAALVIDIKTIETQLLAPQPKTAVVKAVLDSLAAWLKKNGDAATVARIDTLAGR